MMPNLEVEEAEHHHPVNYPVTIVKKPELLINLLYKSKVTMNTITMTFAKSKLTIVPVAQQLMNCALSSQLRQEDAKLQTPTGVSPRGS